MAVFTTVSPAEMSAWLQHYSLGDLLELKGISSGIENTNYFVTTSRGRFVLTLFEKLTATELPFYLNLMAHLARHEIPCPAPAANHQGALLDSLKGKPTCLATRLSGQSVLDPNLAQCAAVGEMLARMHLAGQSYEGRMPNPRGAAWRAETVPQVLPFLNAERAALLQSELATQAAALPLDLPRGVIHADLFRDNVLLVGDAVGGFIDFYFACQDVLLYDVAITVNDWCLQRELGQLDPQRTQAFLSAYHAVRPLSAQERAVWPRLLRLAALRFWLSRLFDFHLPRAGEMVHPHDPGHFERVLRWHIAEPYNGWI